MGRGFFGINFKCFTEKCKTKNELVDRSYISNCWSKSPFEIWQILPMDYNLYDRRNRKKVKKQVGFNYCLIEINVGKFFNIPGHKY